MKIDDIPIYIEGTDNKSLVLKIIKERLYGRSIQILTDISHIKVNRYKEYIILTIFQYLVECEDIIEYFTKRFERDFPKTNKKGTFCFSAYSLVNIDSKDKTSSITFYYKFNLFEKAIFNNNNKK